MYSYVISATGFPIRAKGGILSGRSRLSLASIHFTLCTLHFTLPAALLYATFLYYMFALTIPRSLSISSLSILAN